MSDNAKTYNTQTIARILGIGESTVVKWCLELEKNGYIFNKGLKNNRLFDSHDLESLTYFKELIKIKSRSVRDAGDIVAKRFVRNKDTGKTLSVPEELYNSFGGKMMIKLEEVYEKVNVLTAQHEELSKKLDDVIKVLEQEKIIEVKIKNRHEE